MKAWKLLWPSGKVRDKITEDSYGSGFVPKPGQTFKGLFQNGMLAKETDLFVVKIGIQELDKIYYKKRLQVKCKFITVY